jgi:hypothetical protein
MFKQFYQRLNIALPKFLAALIIGAFLPPIAAVTSTQFVQHSSAGDSPSADLNTIATYLRGYQATDLRNPSFYSYTLDGDNKSITDGGLDMYDAGNNTAPWLKSNAQYSNLNSINSANALAYDVTTASTFDGDFQYVSLGYGTSPDRRPLTMLGTRTVAGNPIGFQKYGNAGSDGGGSLLSGRIYDGSVFNGFTVQAFYRLNYNAGDPSICDLYMLIGQPGWDSSFGTINQYADPVSNGGNGAHFYSSGASTRNLLAITTLLSKGSGTAVTVAELQTIVQNYTLRIREAIGDSLRTVTFSANGGSGSASVASVTQATVGASVTLAGAGTLARSGFTLAGWNTNETGT